MVSTAISNVESQCAGLKVGVRSFSNAEEIGGFEFSVRNGAEWSDALRIAHGTDGEAALTRLSTRAEELLSRIESDEFSDFVKEVSIRRRIRYYGWGSDFSALIRELRVKNGIEVEIETKGTSYNQRQHFMKFSPLHGCVHAHCARGSRR